MDTATIIFILTTLGTAAWGILTRWNLLDAVDLGNEKLNALVAGSRKTAIATDFYIRSMSDGKLTIEEGEVFKTKAAEAILAQLTLVEEITGKQIYNRPEVPLPLPVGGKRITIPELAEQAIRLAGAIAETAQIPDQSAQPVSTEVGA